MKTFRTMLKTELKLSLRGMDMFIFAICVPLAVLIILGIIYGDKPAFDRAEYTFTEQSFGALATISICAGGVMGLQLTQGIKLLKAATLGLEVDRVLAPAVIMSVFALVCITISVKCFQWE